MSRNLATKAPLNPVLFASLTEINDYEFDGNDALALEGINQFAADARRPLTERAEALRVLCDKGLGIGRALNLSDSALVYRYLSQAPARGRA